MSVLADHRADPGDGPAAPSGRADDDMAATWIDRRPSTGRRGSALAFRDVDPGTRPRLPAGALRPDQLRADFGAHFEANYQRLVAQLYAITLNPAEAHDVVPGGVLARLATLGRGRSVGRPHRMGATGGRPVHDAQLAAHGRPARSRTPPWRPRRRW